MGLHACAGLEVIRRWTALVLHGRTCCHTITEVECSAYADCLSSHCMQVSLLRYLPANSFKHAASMHRACTGFARMCHMLTASSQGFVGD